MSEVKRYYAGNIDKDREVYLASDFDRVTAERDALQQLLNAKDERADVLERALSKIKLRCDAYLEAEMGMPYDSVEVCQSIAGAALKPAEGGGDDC